MSGLVDARNVDGVTVAALYGVLVTASATVNTKGSWVDLISAANNLYGADRLQLMVDSNSANAADSSMLADIGLGTTPAGAAIIVKDLPMGYTSRNKSWTLPIQAPAGVAVRARVQAATASRTTRISARLLKGGTYWSGRELAPLSALASSRGLDHVCGNGAWSTWVDLVTSVVGNWRGFVLAWQGAADTTLGARTHFMWQVGLGATPRIVTPSFPVVTDGSEELLYVPRMFWTPIAAGSRVQVRGACEVLANRTLDVTIMGVR